MSTSQPKPKAFAAGASLVWRRQRILWWIFVVNLVLAFMGAAGASHNLADDAGVTLNHSTEAARRLVHGFDMSALQELGSLPQDPLRGTSALAALPSILFLLFMLFATGGILAAYYEDFSLDASAFFEAGARCFWRFVRLLVYFVIAMIPVVIIGSIAGKIYDHIDDVSVSPYASVWFGCAAVAVILLLLMAIRLWFDMTEVIAVAHDERRMHKALRLAAGVMWRNHHSLFWLYFRISVIGWAVFAAGLYLWMIRLHPESGAKALLLSQAMILFWIGARLWQRASEASWYKQYREAQAVSVAPPEPIAPLIPTEEELAGAPR
ncbi:MAG TPA: hypothetical protein VLY23_01405 [Candidatus Acidoferrum sp.]|nr:hypothetical protein [Candidatus Acidoferrum sp.]